LADETCGLLELQRRKRHLKQGNFALLLMADLREAAAVPGYFHHTTVPLEKYHVGLVNRVLFSNRQDMNRRVHVTDSSKFS
jgi:hypothetical protein